MRNEKNASLSIYRKMVKDMERGASPFLSAKKANRTDVGINDADDPGDDRLGDVRPGLPCQNRPGPYFALDY